MEQRGYDWRVFRIILFVFLLGAGLLAGVVRLKWTGLFADFAFLGGAILVIVSLKMAENWAKKAQPEDDPDEPDPFESPQPALFSEELDVENKAWRRAIRWISVAAMVISAVVFFKFGITNSTAPFLAAPFGMIAIAFWASLDRADGKNRDLGHVLATDGRLRWQSFGLSAACLAGGIFQLFMPQKPIQQLEIWQWAVPVTLFFGGFFGLLFLLSKRLGKPDPATRHWTNEQKSLAKWAYIVVLIAFFLSRVTVERWTDGIVEQVRFCLLFFFGGLVPGYLAMDFFKNRHPDFFKNNNEAKRGLQTCIWLSAMLLTLMAAAFFQQKSARNRPVFEKKAVVLEKRNDTRGDWTIRIELDGRSKKIFQPKTLLDQIAVGDTLALEISRSFLGFDQVRSMRFDGK